MKQNIYLILALVLCLNTTFASAQEINLTAIPNKMNAGSVMIITETSTKYFSRALVDVTLDGISNQELILSKNSDIIKAKIPTDIADGQHTIALYFDDNVFGSVTFDVFTQDSTVKSTIDGFDPNPETQNGKPRNQGANPKPILRTGSITNPSGGYISTTKSCTELHIIDGAFTKFDDESFNEWDGIVPLKGQFSNLYLDYCGDDRILYLMNDWVLGNGNYDSTTCYNLFEFVTGGGQERWMVKVYNNIEAGIIVTLNGEDVSSDTNIVIGGRFGFNSSPLDTNEHTMWEFGLKVTEGLYVMRVYSDEVGWYTVGGPSTRIICDENGEGWGLVQAPETVVGYLNKDGLQVNADDKYIPAAGVAGLITEPSEFSGNISNNALTIFTNGKNKIENFCNNEIHKIDGEFSENEWDGVSAAIGRYSNLYAEYCDGTLYVLNDWHVADREPFERSCYNLFELYTGNGSQHWGIYVYNDIAKGIKVFLNGVDVSNDSAIVHGGAFGFSESPLVPTEHAIYEFGIKADEGNWHLYMADPGPSSFCDELPESFPRTINYSMGIRQGIGNYGSHISDLLLNDKHFKLTLSTAQEVDELYSRKLKAIIYYDKAKFEISDYYLADYFGLANKDIKLSIFEEGDNFTTILAESNSNLKGLGDLITIEFLSKLTNNTNGNISFEILFENRGTALFSQKLPTINISVPTDVEESIIEKVEYYPNPIIDGNLTVKITSQKLSKLSIRAYDINGNVFELYNGKINSGENYLNLTLNNFPIGAYIINLRYENQQKSFTINVIR